MSQKCSGIKLRGFQSEDCGSSPMLYPWEGESEHQCPQCSNTGTSVKRWKCHVCLYIYCSKDLNGILMSTKVIWHTIDTCIAINIFVCIYYIFVWESLSGNHSTCNRKYVQAEGFQIIQIALFYILFTKLVKAVFTNLNSRKQNIHSLKFIHNITKLDRREACSKSCSKIKSNIKNHFSLKVPLLPVILNIKISKLILNQCISLPTLGERDLHLFLSV